MSKCNNRNTRTASLTLFSYYHNFFYYSIAEFEQVILSAKIFSDRNKKLNNYFTLDLIHFHKMDGRSNLGQPSYQTETSQLICNGNQLLFFLRWKQWN